MGAKNSVVSPINVRPPSGKEILSLEDVRTLKLYLNYSSPQDIEFNKDSIDNSVAFIGSFVNISTRPKYTTRLCVKNKKGIIGLDCSKSIVTLPDAITEYLINTSRNESISCAGPTIRMIGNTKEFVEGYSDISHPEYTGMYDYHELKSKLASSNLVMTDNELLLTNYPLSSFKSYYDKCTSKYVYFSIILLFQRSPKIKLNFSHANGILINKRTGEITLIEPSNIKEFQGFTRDQIRLDMGILRFANEVLLIENPVMKPILTTCPQAIAEDKNCLFWQLYEVRLLFSNDVDLDSETGPTEAISKFMSSQTKESLASIIENFKLELVKEIIPKAVDYYMKRQDPNIVSAYVHPSSKLGKLIEKYKDTLPSPISGSGYPKKIFAKRRKHTKRKRITTQRKQFTK